MLTIHSRTIESLSEGWIVQQRRSSRDLHAGAHIGRISVESDLDRRFYYKSFGWIAVDLTMVDAQYTTALAEKCIWTWIGMDLKDILALDYL